MKVIRNIFLVVWTIFCFIGVVGNFSHYGLIDWFFIVPFVTIPYLIVLFVSYKLNKKRPKNGQSKETLSTNDISREIINVENTFEKTSIDTAIVKPVSYIETEKSVYRTDGKDISDEEIPYLIQVGYEETLSKEGLYNGQLLDLSFMQERDKNKKEYTTIPTYSELSSIPYEESYVDLREILFLDYINGLPIENPLIAQKWYYDYNLNYSRTIKKLIANGLLSVNHTCVDKMNVAELKNILKAFNLPSSGRKEELIKRIYKNISQKDIDKYFNDAKFFTVTDKGKVLIKNKIT